MEDIDDDSLFDPHNNILATARPYQELDKESTHNCVKKMQQRNNSNDMSDKENRARNGSAQTLLNSNSQIKKEVSYAYKKDVQEYPKFGLPPKNSKNLGSKNFLLPSNTHGNKTSEALKRSDKTPQTLITRDPIKGKYTQKEVILQENIRDSDDPNQFKFHTFKGDSEEYDNYDQ